MKTKNGYFFIDFTKSTQKFTFANIPQKYSNYDLHYVIESKKDNYYSTENVNHNYWYTRVDFIPLRFDYMNLYAFDIDAGVELIDEYKFDIRDFNFMFNLKTNCDKEASIWGNYIDILNKTIDTNFKYGLNISSIDESYDNYEISREKYNMLPILSENHSKNVSSIDIIKKLIG